MLEDIPGYVSDRWNEGWCWCPGRLLWPKRTLYPPLMIIQKTKTASQTQNETRHPKSVRKTDVQRPDPPLLKHHPTSSRTRRRNIPLIVPPIPHNTPPTPPTPMLGPNPGLGPANSTTADSVIHTIILHYILSTHLLAFSLPLPLLPHPHPFTLSLMLLSLTSFII